MRHDPSRVRTRIGVRVDLVSLDDLVHPLGTLFRRDYLVARDAEVVVVVDLVGGGRAEDLQHLVDDDVAARVGVLARERHRRDVVAPELGVGAQEHRRRVHLAVGDALVERPPGGEREEARRRRVPEPARAEVHADPDEAVVAGEEVDVVVARADRPELVARHLHHPPLRAEIGATDRLEHGVVDGLGVVAPHAEGDAREDLVHDPREVVADVVDADVGAGGLVTAVVHADTAGLEGLGVIAGDDVVYGRLPAGLGERKLDPRDLARRVRGEPGLPDARHAAAVEVVVQERARDVVCIGDAGDHGADGAGTGGAQPHRLRDGGRTPVALDRRLPRDARDDCRGAALLGAVAEADVAQEPQLLLGPAGDLGDPRRDVAADGSADADARAEAERCEELDDEVDRVARRPRLLDRQRCDRTRAQSRGRALRAGKPRGDLRPQPGGQREQPAHRPGIPAVDLAAHRAAQRGQQRMQRDGADAHAVLVTPARLARPHVDRCTQPDGREVGGDRGGILGDDRVPRCGLAVAAEVAVAADGAEHAQERRQSGIGGAQRQEPERLELRRRRPRDRHCDLAGRRREGQPDVRQAGDVVARTEHRGGAPSQRGADLVVGGAAQLAAVAQEQPQGRAPAARDGPRHRRRGSHVAAVPAGHRRSGGHGLDRERAAILRGDGRSGGDAGDVVADARRRDVVRVGDRAADRLGVADVAVGAEHAGHRVAGLGAAPQLLDRAVVDVAADRDGDLRHEAIVTRAPARRQGNRTARSEDSNPRPRLSSFS
jgi:hypothetical protein